MQGLNEIQNEEINYSTYDSLQQSVVALSDHVKLIQKSLLVESQLNILVTEDVADSVGSNGQWLSINWV